MRHLLLTIALGASLFSACKKQTPPEQPKQNYQTTGNNEDKYKPPADTTDPNATNTNGKSQALYPRVLISIPEFHITRVRVPDPAAETEFNKAFINAGFKTFDKKQTEKAWKDDVLYKMEKEEDLSAAAALAFKSGTEVLIIGEAFSEAGTKNSTNTGGIRTDLYSVAARVEVKVIRASNGQILFSDAATAKAVNTTEIIAGKDALAKAGAELAKKAVSQLQSVWFDSIVGGGNAIEAIISIPNGEINFNQASSFRIAAAKLPGVKEIIMREFIEGGAQMEFIFEGDAQGLAAQIDGKKIDKRKCTVPKVQDGKIFVNLQ